MKPSFNSARPVPGLPSLGEGGFTLVETMVVLAITAILMGLAVPSMRSMIERNSVNQSVDHLLSSVSFARAEAIKRGFPVLLCRSTGAETGTPACSASTDWSTGWLVFVDLDGDNNFDSTKGDVLLRVQGSLEKNGALTQKIHKILQFRPTGTLNPPTSFTVESPSRDSSVARGVCLTAGGRARVGDCT